MTSTLSLSDMHAGQEPLRRSHTLLELELVLSFVYPTNAFRPTARQLAGKMAGSFFTYVHASPYILRIFRHHGTLEISAAERTACVTAQSDISRAIRNCHLFNNSAGHPSLIDRATQNSQGASIVLCYAEGL